MITLLLSLLVVAGVVYFLKFNAPTKGKHVPGNVCCKNISMKAYNRFKITIS